jgi:hypothetical protein
MNPEFAMTREVRFSDSSGGYNMRRAAEIATLIDEDDELAEGTPETAWCSRAVDRLHADYFTNAR